VWAFIGMLLVTTAALQLTVVSRFDVSGSSSLAGWAVLVTAFVVAELCVVHITIGRDAHSFAFAEIPFICGLFLASPGVVVSARLVAGALVLVWHRRQTVVKLAFNLSQWWFGATAAVIAWHLVAGGDARAVRGWAAALVVALVLELTSVLAITAVIALRGGSVRPAGLFTGALTSSANACFAIVATYVLRADWHGVWALAVLAVFLGLAQRAHVALLRRHDTVERIQGFTHRIGSTDLELDAVVGNVLTGTRELLEVQTVRLELAGLNGGNIRAWVADSDGVRTAEPSATAMLPTTAPARGKRAPVDSLSVLLHGADGPIGALSVSGRLGDVGGLRASDLHLLEALAGHAAIALHNGRLAGRLRDQVEENSYQAMHDALTGLPNRLLFDSTATSALETGGPAAVLLLDLDRFKDVNDTLGHAAGDEVLRDVGRRLRTALSGAACVARLGGDEFAVVLAGADVTDALQCARRISAALSVRLDLTDVTLSLDASIGIALAPEHGTDIATLLRRADVAMYAAKDGTTSVAVYAPERDHHSTARLSLVSDLRESIAKGELVLQYQPKTQLREAGGSGVAALVRWVHPVRGTVPPDEFIEVAERTGLIGPLTDWVLKTALAQCRRWLDDGLDLGVAVNISPRTLHDSMFPARLADLLAAAGVPAAKLTLEITETVLMHDPEGAINTLWDLRRAGVRLSVDDLGVGHSSLAYLKRLPVHEIKIDRSFVTKMTEDADDETIVTAVIEMVHRLRMQVVAEGVEDEVTWHRLAELGADAAQGYWMSRPMPAAEVGDWVRLWSPPTHTASVIPLQRASGGALR
jgi:diguanylate cyclase (GGDEF)-like protein